MADQLLPYDLLLEIFSYLPVKKILQLQLLSRPFRRLAADRRFRLLQSQRNLNASGVFISDDFNYKLDFFPPNHAAGFPPSLVKFLIGVLSTFDHFTASRGLLFYKNDANFFVVNPACNETRTIPAPPVECSPWTYDGFAVKFLDDDDHLKCKYQLVYLQTTSRSSNLHRLSLYDSAARKWIVNDLQVDMGYRFLNLSNLVVFEGSVFVSCICWTDMTSDPPCPFFAAIASDPPCPFIAAIDTSTRHVDFFPSPDSIALHDEIILTVWEEAGVRPWLCLVQYHTCSHKFTLWRWSKGPMWVKFHEVAIDRQRFGKISYDFNLCDSGAMNGMLLFFYGNDQLYAYSFKRQQYMQLETKTEPSYLHRRFISYINSLHPCY